MKKTVMLIICLLAIAAVICSCSGKKNDSAQNNAAGTEAKQTEQNSQKTAEQSEQTAEQSEQTVEQSEQTAGQSEQTAGQSEQGNDELPEFKKPAEVVEIDMTKDDPSTDEIKFYYNDDGSVLNCIYSADVVEFNVCFNYADDVITVYAFTEDGTIVAADEIAVTSQYSADVGFAEINGYYIKGYTK